MQLWRNCRSWRHSVNVCLNFCVFSVLVITHREVDSCPSRIGIRELSTRLKLSTYRWHWNEANSLIFYYFRETEISRDAGKFLILIMLVPYTLTSHQKKACSSALLTSDIIGNYLNYYPPMCVIDVMTVFLRVSHVARLIIWAWGSYSNILVLHH